MKYQYDWDTLADGSKRKLTVRSEDAKRVIGTLRSKQYDLKKAVNIEIRERPDGKTDIILQYVPREERMLQGEVVEG